MQLFRCFISIIPKSIWAQSTRLIVESEVKLDENEMRMGPLVQECVGSLHCKRDGRLASKA
jgi:hypothetical protein